MSDFVPELRAKTVQGGSPRRAILIHGPLQPALDTAASLLRYVVGAAEAPIFHFGPYGHSTCKEQNTFSATKQQTADVPETPVHTLRLLNCYGAHLAGHELHHAPASRFFDDARTLVPEVRQLPGTDPANVLARIHYMEGAVRLLQAWEKEGGERVEQVVLVRSDLAFYSPIEADIIAGDVGIATAEGFSPTTGHPNKQTSSLRYFRNRLTGDFVRGGDYQSFNSDIIVIDRADLDCLENLYRKVLDLFAEGAPPHLETIMYLILVGRSRLRTKPQPHWLYEICDQAEPVAVSVSDHKKPILHGQLALLPQHVISRADALGKRKRTAVLLYGLLRDYATTAGSIIEHVVKPNNAAVFYYGPAQTDRPTRKHGGSFDEHGFFLSNPKGDFDTLQSLEETDLRRVYGDHLRRAKFHNTSQEHFLAVSESIFPREDWMFMLSPHRLLSMFHNINGVVGLLREFENEIGYTFDEIIITRPDLAFYTPITALVKQGELHIAGSEGFDINGHEHQGNAPVYFYKNVLTGDYTPAGRRFTFNDQLFLLKREDLVHFYDIYDQLVSALRNRVPCSPETIFYLLMAQKAGLSVIGHPEWAHEIYRADDPVIKGVNDTPDILHIDPHSPKAARFRSSASHDIHPGKPRNTSLNPASHLQSEQDDQTVVARAGDGIALLRGLLQADGEPSWWATTRSRRLLSKARKERRAGNVAAAERYYARVLRLTPNLQREWVQYGHALKDQGEWRAAIDAYAFALRLKPSDPDATLHHESAVRHVSDAG